MRTPMWILALSGIALLIASVGSDAGEAKKKINIEQKWSGKMAENALAKHAPKVGYLTNQKALEELWAAWKLRDKAPAVDFTKQIVFVQLARGGPNVPNTNYTLDQNGDLRALSFSTRIGGPGFGYSVDVVSREGIKTYQGKPIE